MVSRSGTRIPLTTSSPSKVLAGSTRLGLIRNGNEASLEVQLKAAPDLTRREIAAISGPSPLKGATLATLTPAIAEELGVDAYAEGVAVVDVATDTSAEKYDFQRGDILRTANDKPIRRVARCGANTSQCPDSNCGN